MHHTGIVASHHRWRSFSFLLLKWIRPGFKTPHFHCHFVSQSLWERFSHWQPLLERWWLEVVWSLPLSSSTVDPGVIQRQGNTQCSMGTLCFLGSFGNICNCKQLSCHTLSLQVSCFAMKLSLRHSEGPAGSVFYGTRELLGWVLCEVQNEQSPSAKAESAKEGSHQHRDMNAI